MGLLINLEKKEAGQIPASTSVERLLGPDTERLLGPETSSLAVC